MRKKLLLGSFLALEALCLGACSGPRFTCEATHSCTGDNAQPDASPGGSPDGASATANGTGGGSNSEGNASGGAPMDRSDAGSRLSNTGGARPSGAETGGAADASTGGNPSAGGTDTGPDAGSGISQPGLTADSGTKIVTPPPPDPCLKCASIATCTRSGDAALCTCPSGYDGNGESCTRNYCEALSGQAAPCSAHATCTSGSTAAVCECLAGYDGNGVTCSRNYCEPLAGQTATCGANMTCASGTSSATCTCKAGFSSCDGASDPSPGCETNIETSSKDCGSCGLACAGKSTCSGGKCTQAVTKLAGGSVTMCAILAPAPGAGGGVVDCWGSNEYGTLGVTSTTQNNTTPTPVAIAPLARDLALGYAHTCALSALSDTVSCWGANGADQLGSSGTVPAGTAVQVAVTGATAVAASAGGTCVLTQTGRVVCWGSSSTIGSNTTTTPSPTSVPGITDANAIVGGYIGTCVIRALDGSALCWGTGPFTQTPAPVDDATGNLVTNIVSMSIGYNFYCLAKKDGAVACAGDNAVGELGQGDVAAHTALVTVPGLSGVAQVASAPTSTCARTASGLLYCWGNSSFGQLGLGPAVVTPHADGGVYVATPTLVPGLHGVVEVAGGFEDTCVRLNNAQLECFGDNEGGQVGDGTEIQRYSPVSVAGLP